jgi:hypothetical protein
VGGGPRADNLRAYRIVSNTDDALS